MSNLNYSNNGVSDLPALKASVRAGIKVINDYYDTLKPLTKMQKKQQRDELNVNKKRMSPSFKHKVLVHEDSSTFNNSTIKNSNFEQSEPNTEFCPADVVGVIFDECNLNNCVIPAGAILINCCNHQWIEQNDLEKWIVDENGNPIKPLHEKIFNNYDLSTDPKDIPKEKLEKPLIIKAKENNKARITQLRSDPKELKKLIKKAGEINGN